LSAENSHGRHRQKLSDTIFWAIDRVEIDGWNLQRIKV